MLFFVKKQTIDGAKAGVEGGKMAGSQILEGVAAR
jgi:hypothetical protein